jgi:hypothetical protein
VILILLPRTFLSPSFSLYFLPLDRIWLGSSRELWPQGRAARRLDAAGWQEGGAAQQAGGDGDARRDGGFLWASASLAGELRERRGGSTRRAGRREVRHSRPAAMGTRGATADFSGRRRLWLGSFASGAAGWRRGTTKTFPRRHDGGGMFPEASASPGERWAHGAAESSPWAAVFFFFLFNFLMEIFSQNFFPNFFSFGCNNFFSKSFQFSSKLSLSIFIHQSKSFSEKLFSNFLLELFLILYAKVVSSKKFLFQFFYQNI